MPNVSDEVKRGGERSGTGVVRGFICIAVLQRHTGAVSTHPPLAMQILNTSSVVTSCATSTRGCVKSDQTNTRGLESRSTTGVFWRVRFNQVCRWSVPMYGE